MKFSCPHCDQHIESDDSFAGQNVKCPHCGEEMAVPAAIDPDFGVCPACGQGLTTPDPVICINCGHHFRKIPVDPEVLRQRRVLRMRMLPWLLTATGMFLFFFLWTFSDVIYRGFFMVVFGTTIPGILAAAWAKFIALRADWKTGLMAVAAILLFTFGYVFYSRWQSFTYEERIQMINAIMEHPGNASRFPDDSVRAEVVIISKEMQSKKMSQNEKAQIYRHVVNHYSQRPFPSRYQLRKIIRNTIDEPQYIIFSLIGFNFFNLLLAYAFASQPQAFSRTTRRLIKWDEEIPGMTEDIGSVPPLLRNIDSGFAMAVAVVAFNAIVVGFIDWLIWASMEGMNGRTFVISVVSLQLMVPAIYCIIVCESRRWMLYILLAGIALVYIIAGMVTSPPTREPLPQNVQQARESHP